MVPFFLTAGLGADFALGARFEAAVLREEGVVEVAMAAYNNAETELGQA
jgi:hypothetical protein